MTKYGKKAQESVKKAVHKMKEGDLETGTGKKVKSKKQAVAIGLSEARKKGAKVPSQKSQRASSKKSSRPKSSKSKSRSKSK